MGSHHRTRSLCIWTPSDAVFPVCKSQSNRGNFPYVLLSPESRVIGRDARSCAHLSVSTKVKSMAQRPQRVYRMLKIGRVGFLIFFCCVHRPVLFFCAFGRLVKRANDPPIFERRIIIRCATYKMRRYHQIPTEKSERSGVTGIHFESDFAEGEPRTTFAWHSFLHTVGPPTIRTRSRTLLQ